MFHLNFGAQWVNRIRKTRVLLPRRLTSYASSLFPIDGSQPSPIDLPSEWKSFSIEEAPSLCALNDLNPDSVRRGWMALPADIDWEHLEAELVKQDQERPVIEKVLVKLQAGLAPERDALSPERLALDGESRAVLQAVHASSAWTELREQLVPLIRRFEEVPKEEWPPLLDRLEEWNELYPWSPIVLQERVVRLDQAGHPDRALDLIEAAVLIEPGRPALWRSLGAVYARLGWEREAAVCRGIRAFIEEET
jgi:tetratricopeptide (TPR) repeat protein